MLLKFDRKVSRLSVVPCSSNTFHGRDFVTAMTCSYSNAHEHPALSLGTACPRKPSANHTYFWSGDCSRIRTWHGVQAENRPQGDSRGACCKQVAYGPASSCSIGCYECHHMPYNILKTKLENQLMGAGTTYE